MVSRVSILAALFVINMVTAIFPVTYDNSALDRVLEKVKNRAPLSKKDTTAKTKTLATLMMATVSTNKPAPRKVR